MIIVWYFSLMNSLMPYRHTAYRQRRHLFMLMILLLWTGCALGPSQPPSPYQEWQLFDLHTGQPITFEALTTRILTADVLYIGEEHYNPFHIQAAVRLVTALEESGRHPTLAMEMFSWDGQQALDHYSEGTLSEDRFLEAARWEQNWGGEFSNYQPLVTLARDHHIPLLALNPPRPLVRTVAKQGLIQGLTDPAMEPWDLPPKFSLDDPDYHRVIYDQIVHCHPGLPEHVYQRIYEASIFRDEGMAKIILDYLASKTEQDGPLVSYTGGGHIQYNIPLPGRVQQHDTTHHQHITIYLMALDPSREQEIQEAMEHHLADYLWLTPLGPNGPQPRCG